MESQSTFVIESRLQLFSALAEAAEVEHNLMCLYLYAMFSLKRSEAEGVSAKELEAIGRWRKVLLGVALEEMTHLTLVSNLAVSIGGSPSFLRPNFPSSPGLYPDGIVVELAKFDMSTLDHFIYLERPRSQELSDGESFKPALTYTRVSEKNRLMPTSGDYKTVGELYLSIKDAIENLSSKYEGDFFFCGPRSQQIGPLDSPLPGLTLVSNKADALRAIETIITQGEGASDTEDSHFNRFREIKREYQELLSLNPNFEPARNVARNPVMRKPLNPENRIWITEPIAAKYMDLANALYGMMLRLLVQIYTIDNRPKEAKATLLSASYSLMHSMANIAETLTYLPVNENDRHIKAGMSFAMVRSLAPLDRSSEKQLLCERYSDAIAIMRSLQTELEQLDKQSDLIQTCAKQLTKTIDEIATIQKQISAMPTYSTPLSINQDGLKSSDKNPEIAGKETTAATRETSKVETSESPSEVETSETSEIKLLFEAKKCIHSRHCVTELPNVFKANTPGKWIFAENTEAETLAAVARECPSGAIQYQRKDGARDEAKPDVNLMRVRENGPYAFLGHLQVDQEEVGMRATLCRCGQSKNKPFCDGSHTTARFTASGEPATLDDTSLRVRNGKVKIDRVADGPLAVSGNVEICSGTGRVVLRTENVKLCHCGQSKQKPVCDSSHVAAGFRDNPLKPAEKQGAS